MKRLLLGLSIASGVAMVGVFALTQAKRGGALAADASAAGGSQGQSGASGDPWVQPMPKTMSNSVGDALGSDPFGPSSFSSQRSAGNAGQTPTTSQSQGSTTGVQIRTVSNRQVPESQGSSAGGAAGAAGDPFAGLAPSGDAKGPTAAPPRNSGVAGNETRSTDTRVNELKANGGNPPPVPAEPAVPGAFAGGTANPLRVDAGPGLSGGKSGEFYDSAPPGSRGTTQGARTSSQNDASGIGAGDFQSSQSGAAPPAGFALGASGGQSNSFDRGSFDRGSAGSPPNILDQNLAGGSTTGGGLGNAGTPASLASSSGARQFGGQLASASIREGAGLPGGKQLEGNQLPTLAIQKIAPPEIHVNRPAVFEIQVRNTGPVTAREVVIQDRVPQGTQFVRSSPDAVPTASGDLEWRFDAIPPRGQQVIKVELKPLKRGDIGSVATVRFSADASARSKCTCPDLRVEVGAARQTLIGDALPLTIAVANMGDGPAIGVVVAEQIPDKFDHAQGQLLENELGTLKPGESRELKLTLKAARPGMGLNRLAVRAEGDQRVEKQLELEVVAPLLDIQVQGPAHQFLQREATYGIQIHNQGTAAAKTVKLSTLVPTGFRFVAANNYGEFDPKTNRVNWELVELPAGQKDRVEIKLVAVEPGTQQLQVEGRAQRNVQVGRAHQVVIEGVAAVRFEVVHKGNALEIGAEKVYEIRVNNDGTSEATHVYVSAEFPPGLQPLGGNGPLQATVSGNKVVFGPLPRLAPRADTSFFVQIRAQAAGDHVVRFQVASAEQQAATTKEEVLKVR